MLPMAAMLSIEDPIGNLRRSMNSPWSFGAPEHAVPLQPQLKIGFVDVLPAHTGEFFDFTTNEQAIFVGFVLLDLVEFLPSSQLGEATGVATIVLKRNVSVGVQLSGRFRMKGTA